jgi:hypothetical protein
MVVTPGGEILQNKCTLPLLGVTPPPPKTNKHRCAHLFLPEALKGNPEGEQLKHDDAKAVAAAAAATQPRTLSASLQGRQHAQTQQQPAAHKDDCGFEH